MKKLMSISLLLICVFSFMLSYAQAVSGDIAAGMLRFHILANSNSEYDQKVKLEVRDYVLLKISESSASPYSTEFMNQAESFANEYLVNKNVPYRAKATFVRTFFPQKSYKSITLPAGRYNALELLLGEGDGENWWCVAYPQLCFTEDVSGELSDEAEKILRENMSKESYEIISGQTEYRLWIVDFIGNIIR